MKTCDKCKHYTKAHGSKLPGYEYDGMCALMKYDAPISINTAIPWDYEDYNAGVSVGPKFGCIHWVKAREA